MAARYLLKKYDDIRGEFSKNHEKGYRSAVIIKRLAKKYYMAESTIEDIVYQTGKYGTKKEKTDDNQLTLFDDETNSQEIDS